MFAEPANIISKSKRKRAQHGKNILRLFTDELTSCTITTNTSNGTFTEQNTFSHNIICRGHCLKRTLQAISQHSLLVGLKYIDTKRYIILYWSNIQEKLLNKFLTFHSVHFPCFWVPPEKTIYFFFWNPKCINNVQVKKNTNQNNPLNIISSYLHFTLLWSSLSL